MRTPILISTPGSINRDQIHIICKSVRAFQNFVQELSAVSLQRTITFGMAQLL